MPIAGNHTIIPGQTGFFHCLSHCVRRAWLCRADPVSGILEYTSITTEVHAGRYQVKIVSWNIQATKGCDDRYDFQRIVDAINDFGDVDVICLQEVSRHIEVYNGDDQMQRFAQSYPEFESLWAAGFSTPNVDRTRSEFGNLTLVKKPLLVDARLHCLPHPHVDARQIPRTMVEAVVRQQDFTFTIFNTHLAYHSDAERVAQLKTLAELRDEAMSHLANDPQYNAAGAFRHPPASEGVLLCGDLNVDLKSDEFSEHVLGRDWLDCWDAQFATNPDSRSARSPTCGCFDTQLWSQGAHVRDFFLATEAVAAKTGRVVVNTDTDASDHQPLLMEVAL